MADLAYSSPDPSESGRISFLHVCLYAVLSLQGVSAVVATDVKISRAARFWAREKSHKSLSLSFSSTQSSEISLM